MHSKIMIVVSQTGWWCTACKFMKKHTASIDEHLKNHHLDLLSLASAAIPDSLHCLELDEDKGISSHLEKMADEERADGNEKLLCPGPVQEVHFLKRSRHIEKEEAVEPQIRNRTRSARALTAVPDIVSLENGHAVSRRMKSLSNRQISTRHKDKGHQGDSAKSNSKVLKRKLRGQSNQAQTPVKAKKTQLVVSVEKVHADSKIHLGPNQCEEQSNECHKKQHLLSVEKDEADLTKSISSSQKQKECPKPARAMKTRFNPGETKRPGIGGKPTKRTSPVADQEKKRLAQCYADMQNICTSEQKTFSVQAITHLEELDSVVSDNFLSMETVGNREAAFDSSSAEINQDVSPSTSQLEAEDNTTKDKEHQSDSSAPKRHKTYHQSEKDNAVDHVAAESLSDSVSICHQKSNENQVRLRRRDDPLTSNIDKNPPLFGQTVISCHTKTDFSADIQSRTETVTALAKENTGQVKDKETNRTVRELCETDTSTSNIHGTNVQSYQEDFCGQSSFQMSLSNSNISAATHCPLQYHVSCENEGHKGLPTNFVATTKSRQDAAIFVSSMDPISHSATHSSPHFAEPDASKHASDPNLMNSSDSQTVYCLQSECSDVEWSASVECKDWIINRTSFSFSNQKPAVSFDKPSEIHVCTVCHAKFSSRKLLDAHLSQLPTDSVQCKNCSRLFHSVHNLNLHVFGDHEKKSLPFCFECGSNFQSMESFERHLFQHNHDHEPDLLYREYHFCQICKTDIPCQYNSLQKHYFKKHQITLCLECFVGSKLQLLSDAALAKEHRHTHVNFCNMCVQDFPSSESLQAHHNSHSSCQYREDGHGEVCERCHMWCPNKAVKVLHHKEHQLQMMRTWRAEKWGVGFTCVHCEKVLRNKRNLQRHIAQQHSSCRSYKFHCEFCGIGVDSRSRLKDHIALHHLGIKRYSCEFCSESFTCTPTLRRHVLKEHALDKQYTCEICGEKFCDKIRLMRHTYLHTGSARFMCEKCGKGFPSSSEFKKHTAVHAEKRDFICEGCGQGYKRKEHLKRHTSKCSKAVHLNL